jgi:hypothetical protein
LKHLLGTAAAVSILLAGSVWAAPVTSPGRTIDVKTTDYTFSYIYPAAAGRIPALKAWLDKDAAERKAQIASFAHEGRADAKTGDFDFSPYDSEAEWRVVTDLPAWLSLSGVMGDYSGGAHPNHGPTAILWDKARNRQIKVVDLFTSPSALRAAIQKPFCAALDQQRAQNRNGERADPGTPSNFAACLDPAKEVMILGSADHAHFTRIGILMGPYEAGPYIEGDYEVTLPVTSEVLAAIRPEYRLSFALAR